MAGLPFDVTFYLTVDGRLSPDLPAEGLRAADATLADAVASVGTFPGQAWLAPPVEVAWRVTGALLDAQIGLVAQTPAASSTQAAIEAADVYVWVGDERQLRIRKGEIGPAQLVPGQVSVVTTSMFTQTGGLIIPKGARPAFYVLPTYVSTDASPLQFTVGGDAPTRITMRVQPIELDVAGSLLAEQTYDGSLEARPPGDGQTSGANIATFPLKLSPGHAVRRIEIAVEPVVADARRLDLDLFFLGGDGSALAEGLTEHERERIDLYAPNVPPEGDYTILVRNTSQVPGGFRLVLRTYALT